MGESYADKLTEAFDENNLPEVITERFCFLELLASNELSDTYLLSCRNTDRRFVLKMFRNKELYSESELLQDIKHKGLPVFEPHLMCDGTLYTLREFIEGVSLDEFLHHHPGQNMEMLIRIVIDVCDIISLLHSQPKPVIHRDIKPSNIIIGTDDMNVTLIDFGISRIYSETSRKDTVIVASQGFSPPEQYGFIQTDRRADIYSLGAVLRYCITGSTESNAVIPDNELEQIIAKCTAFAPDARYQDSAELKAALLKYLEYISNDTYDDGTAKKLSKYETPEGYDDHDYQKLAAFFSYDENEAIIRSIHAGFNIRDPRTWEFKARVESDKAYFHIIWHEGSAPKKVEKIYIVAIDTTGDVDLRDIDAMTYTEIRTTGITGLDLSGCSALERVYCYENRLTALNVKNCVSLDFLSCYDNDLKELDVSDSLNIKVLWCHFNKISKFKIPEPCKLEILSCGRNRLPEFDPTNCNELTELHLWTNLSIKKLDLSGNKRLEFLSISGMDLDRLDLSNNSSLKYLWVSVNKLTEVIIPPDSELMYFAAGSNLMTSLLQLEKMTKICYLDISNNPLDINNAEVAASFSKLQAVIDKNKNDPPDGYDPVWDDKLHGLKFKEELK